MKICIVKLSAMGDIIHTMIVLQFLKKNIPNIQIDWVVESGFSSILKNNPNIDNILPVNLKKIKTNKSELFSQITLIKKYARNNYDIVIDAQGLVKSAIVAKILGKKTIIGFDKTSTREGLASIFYNQKVSSAYEKNVIERNIDIICKSLNIEVSKEEILNKKPFLYFKDYNFKSYDITFILGASKESKIYPKEKFLEIANLLKAYSIEVVWGNQYEKQTAEFLAKKCDNVTLSEKTDLDKLKCKISKSSLIIGADTGPTHMAWALNIPSITIFGNTPEYRNTYMTDINQVIKSNSKVNPLKLNYNDFSIREIDYNDIVFIAKKLLK